MWLVVVVVFGSANREASRDWHGQNKDGDKLDDSAVATYMDRCTSFMKSKNLTKGQKVPKLMTKKLANKSYIRCLDHALLCGTGLTLQSFMVADPPARLQPGEVRYPCSMADLPSEIQAICPGRVYKVCVQSADKKTTKFECSSGADRLLLQVCSDQGSVGWPSWYFLYFYLQVRGWFWADPAHRRNDNHLNSYGAAQISWVKNEMLLLVSLGSAPFKGCGHYGVYSEAAEEYLCSGRTSLCPPFTEPAATDHHCQPPWPSRAA